MSEYVKSEKPPRWMELIPGGLTWGSFILLALLTYFYPIVAMNVLIVYATFWLVRAFFMSGRLIYGYNNYRRDIKVSWIKKLKHDFSKEWKDIYHLVIIPTYKEDKVILEETIDAITQSDYPLTKIIFVLATEERDGERVRPIAKELQNKYKKDFFEFLVIEHPKNLTGEIIGKGANITWAGKKTKKFLYNKTIAYNKVICTTMDADNRVHHKYFAALSYAYLKAPEPLYTTFQPIPMFLNNIWQIPTVFRLFALGSSFWQIIESTRPYRLRNFSAHAQVFSTLVKTDFWSTTTIVEDGHQFWRTYFRFNGKHHVVPISVPIYQDAVLSPRGYTATFVEQYLQIRRWAWGCSDTPYVLYHVLGNSKLPFFDKWVQFFRLIEGHFSWAATPIILGFYSWLPGLLHPDRGGYAISYTFPFLYNTLLRFSVFGLIITLTISLLLLPPLPASLRNKPRWKIIGEWIIAPIVLPIVNLLFSSIPAIDSQTRLMFGKYLDYRVTEKHSHRQDLSRHRAGM